MKDDKAENDYWFSPKLFQVFNFPDIDTRKLPRSPRTPKSPRKSPRSFKSPSDYNNQETYFNFNLPSPKKAYSQNKIFYQHSTKTPSLEFKVSNVDGETSNFPKCNIRTNPCYDEDLYASTTSINESENTMSSSRCRKSTSDLTDMTEESVSSPVLKSMSRPASPRRRGSMKGGLAYLASRRGSRDSVASNVSNVSNEDIGPLNFQNTVRGRQRRTSNFLELPGEKFWKIVNWTKWLQVNTTWLMWTVANLQTHLIRHFDVTFIIFGNKTKCCNHVNAVTYVKYLWWSVINNY